MVVLSTVVMVWACPLSVESYAAAGREPVVPRRRCLVCKRPMMFWPGYERYVRDGGTRRIWVRRAKCGSCRVSHALLPSFALPWRFYAVEVIGAALGRMAAGASARAAAGGLGLPYATVRDWRYRYRARAPTLAAGFAAMAVALGAPAPLLSARAEIAGLQALGAAWSAAQARFGPATPPVWRLAGTVTGGGLLATTIAPSWTPIGGQVLLPPTPFSSI